MSDITQLLSAIDRADPRTAEQLLPQVYEELRRLATQRLAHEKPGHTLQATALVHESYLRLVDTNDVQRWDSRGHFFAAAAEAMRRILIENARRKATTRHGGGRKRIDLDEAVLVADRPPDYLVALDEALTKLGAQEPIKAELVKLRFYAGLTVPEAAKVLGISVATAERYWTYARVRLYCELQNEPESPGD